MSGDHRLPTYVEAHPEGRLVHFYVRSRAVTGVASALERVLSSRAP